MVCAGVWRAGSRVAVSKGNCSPVSKSARRCAPFFSVVTLTPRKVPSESSAAAGVAWARALRSRAAFTLLAGPLHDRRATVEPSTAEVKDDTAVEEEPVAGRADARVLERDALRREPTTHG